MSPWNLNDTFIDSVEYVPGKCSEDLEACHSVYDADHWALFCCESCEQFEIDYSKNKKRVETISYSRIVRNSTITHLGSLTFYHTCPTTLYFECQEDPKKGWMVSHPYERNPERKEPSCQTDKSALRWKILAQIILFLFIIVCAMGGCEGMMTLPDRLYIHPTALNV